MFKRIISFFNRKEPLLDELGVFNEPSDRIQEIVSKIPKSMTANQRREFAIKAFSSKEVMTRIVEDLIHEHIKFRTRNVSKQELTDIILGALNAFDAVIESVNLWSAEHEQNVEDKKPLKKDEVHPDYPLSSNSNIDIL